VKKSTVWGVFQQGKKKGFVFPRKEGELLLVCPMKERKKALRSQYVANRAALKEKGHGFARKESDLQDEERVEMRRKKACAACNSYYIGEFRPATGRNTHPILEGGKGEDFVVACCLEFV